MLLEVAKLLRCCSGRQIALVERPYSEVLLTQNREQFAFVVASLRKRLRSGDYVLGEPLTVNALANAWGVSATPVREALARLAGEGLVEDRRGRGYFAWRLDVSDLTDLYFAQETLTLTALSGLARCHAQRATPSGARSLAVSATPAPELTADGGDDAPLFWEALTWRVARAAGHRFLLDAQSRLADRLAPARCVEPRVLREDLADLNGLADQVNRRNWRRLSADIAPFFARRRAAASGIVDELRGGSTFQMGGLSPLLD